MESRTRTFGSVRDRSGIPNQNLRFGTGQVWNPEPEPAVRYGTGLEVVRRRPILLRRRIWNQENKTNLPFNTVQVRVWLCVFRFFGIEPKNRNATLRMSLMRIKNNLKNILAVPPTCSRDCKNNNFVTYYSAVTVCAFSIFTEEDSNEAPKPGHAAFHRHWRRIRGRC